MEEKGVRGVLWENVTRLIEERGTNPWQLALKAGVGPASITRLKGGETSTRLDVLEKIADYFGVPVWQLLKPAEDTGFSEEALELAELFDAIKDPDGRQSAMAITRLVLTGQIPSPAPAPAASPATPSEPPAPSPVPRRRAPNPSPPAPE